MKNTYLMAAILAFAASNCVADTIEFSVADTDEDGVLSIVEATASLKNVTIVDGNGDGLLSKDEAESAIAGLKLPRADDSTENLTINEDDYAMILEVIATR